MPGCCTGSWCRGTTRDPPELLAAATAGCAAHAPGAPHALTNRWRAAASAHVSRHCPSPSMGVCCLLKQQGANSEMMRGCNQHAQLKCDAHLCERESGRDPSTIQACGGAQADVTCTTACWWVWAAQHKRTPTQVATAPAAAAAPRRGHHADHTRQAYKQPGVTRRCSDHQHCRNVDGGSNGHTQKAIGCHVLQHTPCTTPTQGCTTPAQGRVPVHG